MGNPVPAEPAAAAAPAAAPATAPAAAAAPVRKRCQYGAQCMRKNPDHKAEFSHPQDADWDAGAAGYCPAAAPAAPFPAADGQTQEDRGLMGGLAGAGTVAAGLGAANHFGAFGGKTDPNHPEAGKTGFVKEHPGMALAAGAGALLLGAMAGSKAQDSMSGGKHGKHGKDSGGGLMSSLTGGLVGGKKKKTGKKKEKSKKGGKKTKSRDFDPNESDSSSSYETGSDDSGYDPNKHKK